MKEIYLEKAFLGARNSHLYNGNVKLLIGKNIVYDDDYNWQYYSNDFLIDQKNTQEFMHIGHIIAKKYGYRMLVIKTKEGNNIQYVYKFYQPNN